MTAAEQGRRRLAAAGFRPAAARGCAPGLNLDNVEREMVFKALTQTGGHHDKAARMLGISRRSLSRKLKIYGAAAEALESSVA